MKRNRIRLTESDLHRIVKESVNRIIAENSEDAWEQLRVAKQSGDAQAITDALHNLEAELEREGKFVVGGNVPGGTWRSTNRKAFGKTNDKGDFERDPRFTQTWER